MCEDEHTKRVPFCAKRTHKKKNKDFFDGVNGRESMKREKFKDFSRRR